MKAIRLVLKGLIFFAAFMAAVWIFMPWKQVGEFALNIAEEELGKRGMSLSYGSVEKAKSGFRVNNLTIDGLMKFSFDSFTFEPSAVESLLNTGPTAHISFRRGEVAAKPPLRLVPMAFGNGRAAAVVTPGEIVIEDLFTDGEFAISGVLTIDLTEMRIGRADAPIRVADAIESNMQSFSLLLPLEQEGPGNWRLRRP